MLLTATLTTPIPTSFRVQQVAGMFDLPLSPVATTTISAELPGLDEPWTVGAIVGPSGSGKTTLARQAYAPPTPPPLTSPPSKPRDSIPGSSPLTPNTPIPPLDPHPRPQTLDPNSSPLITSFDWPTNAAIIDAFPPHLTGKTITATLAAVGLSTPPVWVRPYHTLSTGQRFRCDLARALLLPQTLIVFDEFTSVVDRQVARFASAAIARLLRKRIPAPGSSPKNFIETTAHSPLPESPTKPRDSVPGSSPRPETRYPRPALHPFPSRFVAVTCHYDVLDWLEVDWYLDLATGKLARGRLQRPPIRLSLHRCPQNLWPLFSKHHYLSTNLNPASRCYLAVWNDSPIAFCATMPTLGFPHIRRVHRLVVLPDYQGLGVGPATLNAVAQYESSLGPISSILIRSRPKPEAITPSQKIPGLLPPRASLPPFLNSRSEIRDPKSLSPSPSSQTPDPKPRTLSPFPYPPNPKPQASLRITTSHPALIRQLRHSPRWRCLRVTKCGRPHRGLLARTGRKVGSPGRITATFQYLPQSPGTPSLGSPPRRYLSPTPPAHNPLS